MESLHTISSLAIADFGLTDRATTEAAHAYNARANLVIAASRELLDDLQAAPELLALEPGKIVERAAKLRNRRAALLASARDAWRDRAALLGEIEVAIRGEIEELQGTLVATEAAAARQLEAIGIAPHLLPAWHESPEVAKHQFRHVHLGRTQSVMDVRHVLDQRSGDLRAIGDLIAQSRAEADRLEADLERVIARELAIA